MLFQFKEPLGEPHPLLFHGNSDGYSVFCVNPAAKDKTQDPHHTNGVRIKRALYRAKAVNNTVALRGSSLIQVDQRERLMTERSKKGDG